MSVCSILGVQVSVVLYAWLCKPSADRIMNLLIMSQFSFEAMSTALLLWGALQSEPSDSEELQSLSFVLGVLSLVAPVAQSFYDAVIVNIFKRLKGGFTWKGFFFSMMGLIVMIPTTVMRLVGGSCCDSAAAMSSSTAAGDDANKLAMKVANDGLVAHIEEEATEVAARLF